MQSTECRRLKEEGSSRPPRPHLFAELETRVRASDLLSFPQPLRIKEFIPEAAAGDRETGLYYAKARYYDPELGIFLTQDPFEGQIDTPPSLHRYLYAYQNPTVYVDRTGRQTEETAEERVAFLQQFGGVLREGEEPPPGTVLTTDSLGVRIVTPVAQLERNAAGQETEAEEGPGLFDRIVDFFVGDTLEEGEKLVEETSELEQTLNDGINRSRRMDVEELAEREAIRTLGDSNGGLPFVAASGRQAGEVTKQAGRTALEAEESASKISILGFFKHLGERALGRLIKHEAREELVEEATEAGAREGARGALSPPSRVPNAGGVIRSFVTEEDEVFFRVFSGDSRTGGFLVRARPGSRAQAIEGLALPPGNEAQFIQEVLVPAGTRLQRSRALPAFGRRGGMEQFELLDLIPDGNFGPGVPFQ